MQHLEVAVHVPQDRLAEFYAVVGRWLGGEPILPTKRRGTGRSRRRGGRSASSYDPLGMYLAQQRGSEECILSFQQIEDILQRPLPRSAYKHRAWWANTDTHSQALTWLTAGWKLEHADLEHLVITFSRVHSETG